MARAALRSGYTAATTTTLITATRRASSYTPSAADNGRIESGIEWRVGPEPWTTRHDRQAWEATIRSHRFSIADLSSTGRGILIGMLSAFGTAALVGLLVALVYFFRYTSRGRILLDRMARPGEFDDEQQYLREEEDAMADMDEMQRAEYMRAKGELYWTHNAEPGNMLTTAPAFVQANPPESVHTDISLSQFLAIQEKGVSAWEFEPELEIANCFVEARTEIEFFDSECSVQSNLPIPKQNEVYYWEAKLYDRPETTLVSIGLTTKPYPLFRLPGLHKYSVAYTSTGQRRFNQPFTATSYGPAFVQGDVIGVGYRPRSGTIFFTRNGKKLDDVAHGLKLHNFFPTVGANGPCNVHVNFGQMGFVFIEANVKKWGLAPMTGSLAPPPPYGSEAGSILLESGRDGIREGHSWMPGHVRTSSAQLRLQGRPARSPGPERSPTDISLAQLNLMDFSDEPATHASGDDEDGDDDIGEGTSRHERQDSQPYINPGLPLEPADHPPPDYEGPEEDDRRQAEDDDDSEDDTTPRASTSSYRDDERRSTLR